MGEIKNDTIDPVIIDRLQGGDEKAFNAVYDMLAEHTNFSKAFRKRFGFTPQQYRDAIATTRGKK